MNTDVAVRRFGFRFRPDFPGQLRAVVVSETATPGGESHPNHAIPQNYNAR